MEERGWYRVKVVMRSMVGSLRARTWIDGYDGSGSGSGRGVDLVRTKYNS